MIWSTSRIQNLLIAPALVFAAACQSSGPSEFPDQNRSLHGELQVFIDSATDVEILPRNSIAILESLIDGSYDGQTVVGVQEFTGSIEAVESFRKENIKSRRPAFAPFGERSPPVRSHASNSSRKPTRPRRRSKARSWIGRKPSLRRWRVRWIRS